MTIAEIGTKVAEQSGDQDDYKRELDIPFPWLTPGRALVDPVEERLIEFFHAPEAASVPVEGFGAYDPQQGFDYGHIISQKVMAYRVSDLPALNQHGEIPLLNARPSMAELTEKKPDAFLEDVLGGSARPLVLVERPSVAFEEAIGAETYEMLGWYNPHEEETSERLGSIEEMSEYFCLDETRLGRMEAGEELLELPSLCDTRLAVEQIPSEYHILFRPDGLQMDTEPLEIHIHSYHYNERYDKFEVYIDSPPEARFAIKDYDDVDESDWGGLLQCEPSGLDWDKAHPTYNGELEAWAIDFDAVGDAIQNFIDHGAGVSVTLDVLTRFGQSVRTYSVEGELGNPDLEPTLAPPVEAPARETFTPETVSYETDGEVTGMQAVRESNPEALTFIGLDEAVMANPTISCSTSQETPTVPDSVEDEWVLGETGMDDGDAIAAYHHPTSGTVIRVCEVVEPISEHPDEREVWGTELAIEVVEAGCDPETVVVLADEHLAVQTVISHLASYTRA